MTARNYQLFKWINDNNPPMSLSYSKGWWDYVELLQRIAAKLDAKEARVIDTYVVDTPPPEEKLTMPAVVMETKGVSFALRFDFGRNPTRDLREWMVSVRRRSPYLGPLFGLFDADEDLRSLRVTGLAPDWLFGSYREDPAKFSCALDDEWDVWTLVRLVGHEP